MNKLKTETCIPCRRGSPALSEAEITELKPEVPLWQVPSPDGIPRLERIFRFKNFAEALAFTISAGELAERENHHPAILTEWGKVTITLWTHSIRGLHRNDFIMAAKIDGIYEEASGGK